MARGSARTLAARLTVAAGAVVALGCGRSDDVTLLPGADTAAAAAAPVPIVREQFITPIDSADNVDGPAVWHGPEGQHWLLSTAKSTDVVLVNDAATGAPIRRVGGPGAGVGQLRRPNGVTVIGDAMLVVERDNHRVQAFRLPAFTPMGTFGDSLLRLPYGIGWFEEKPGTYMVYVTDNYETPEETVPPDAQLGERVKQFRVTIGGAGISARHLRSFGDTAGAGVLRVVESIAPDAANDRLLIAEETEVDSYIKVYDLNGRFTGRVFGRGYFPQQAEGIALYACGEKEGYWITTDQGDETNTYHLFDRMTLEHVAAFTGAQTRRTDGVALTQKAFGPFPAGVFYASHVDASVGALSWSEIAAATGVRSDCVR
ncbi:MAG TPA: hypothetical protein VHQ45_13215 [Gemmatimonadaceae bacterium]|nr:hypothetical protein [Gemmatimonadaceae bacterium]